MRIPVRRVNRRALAYRLSVRRNSSWSRQRPFQAKVALQHFHNVTGQRQNALFPALAQNVQLRIGQFQIFELDR